MIFIDVFRLFNKVDGKLIEIILLLLVIASLVKFSLKLKYDNKDLIKELNQVKINQDSLIRDSKFIKKIDYSKSRNSITNLPNKGFLEKRIGKMIYENKDFSIALLDIDNFKSIQSSISYSAREKLSEMIANDLKIMAPENSFVTHISKDEFVFVFKSKEDAESLDAKIKALNDYFNRVWNIETYEFQTSVSIGVASYPKDGKTYTELLKSANITMDLIKKTGKNNYLFYKEEFKLKNLTKVVLSRKIQDAIDNELFQIFYQPQIDLYSGLITGFEGLIRWNDKEEGFISPGKFIPLAEETGQIYAIEKFVFKTILDEAINFNEISNKELKLSINLSSKTLMNEIMFNELIELISLRNREFNGIIIEITETAIISDMKVVIRRLERLKRFGFEIALDDFGTGYSSLTHLKDLPIDQIKIDQSFIRNMFNEKKKRVIIKTLINLSKKLGYSVTAEGVETKEEYEYMKILKCDKVQGYYISRPINLEQTKKIIKKEYSQNFYLKRIK